MTQNKYLNDLTNLSKEEIANCYFDSLGNKTTRQTHTLLAPKIAMASSNPTPPSIHDIELDFTSWYGGFIGLGKAIDAGVELPPVPEMCRFVTQNFERAKQAIAA